MYAAKKGTQQRPWGENFIFKQLLICIVNISTNLAVTEAIFGDILVANACIKIFANIFSQIHYYMYSD